MNNITFSDGTLLNPTKIIGVGLNYGDHIAEMHSIKPIEPVLFLKPTTSLCNFSDPISLPKKMGSVHFELELAVCIGSDCRKVTEDQASSFIAGFAMALDLTLRDIQSRAKNNGHPWAVAKGFDNSCPVTRFFKKPLSEVEDTEIHLVINGQTRQKAKTNLMINKIPALISYISGIFTLLPGDIILTGTPAGVGPLTSGDKIEASIQNLVSEQTFVE